MRRPDRGFTLIEAAIAIGVVAILSGIIVPLVLKSIHDAKMARAKNDINIIAAAIAHQMKDLSERPCTAEGPNGSSGLNQEIWVSGGSLPRGGLPLAGGTILDLDSYLHTNNYFINLFSAPNNQDNVTLERARRLFGLDAQTPFHYEGQYHGPYLAPDMCKKTDPWGRTYLIFGYNRLARDSKGPIWVVCAGPSGKISELNLRLFGGRNVDSWTYSGESKENIALRIN